MNNHRLLMRPHRLLLARFFSRGLIAAVVVTFVVGTALTQLELENYLRHATNAVRERVARLAAHIGHQLENPAATAHQGVIIGSSDPAPTAAIGRAGGGLKVYLISASAFVTSWSIGLVTLPWRVWAQTHQADELLDPLGAS